MVILLASVASIMFAATGVTAKRGMQHTAVVPALIVSLIVTTVIVGAVVLVDPPDRVGLKEILLLAAAGLVGDGIGRFSMLTAVNRLGPSTAVPIQTAAYPFVTLIGGIVIFSERITLLHLLGVIAIVTGIWILLGGRSEAESAVPRQGTWRRWLVLVFPVMAGVGFAVSDLFRKAGLNELPDPAFGTFVAVATILVMWLISAAAVPRVRKQLRLGPGWGWLVVSGVCVAISLLALFAALDQGDVSVVSPIIAAQPVAVVALSWLILRNIEKVTPRMMVGAVMVVGGVVLIGFAS
jgi:drug/metabolite transporter (DMT)-like permease